MDFFKRYSIVIGGLALILVIVVLVSVPSDVLSQQATFIGTELEHSTERETRVLTKMDLGDAEHMKAFPKQFGNWLGLDYAPSAAAETLGADVILLRTYLNTARYQPIHLAVVQADEPSSFHPPPICYRAGGWEIEEEGVEEVLVSDVTWAGSPEPISIAAKRLVASKGSDAEVEEREVVLYYYVKGSLFEDTVTMVQVSASAPVDGPYDEALEAVRGFVGETIPYLFQPDEDKGEMLAVYLAGSWGGIALMAILLLIPVGIMIYPRTRR